MPAHSTIHVLFVDTKTGQALAQADMPLDRLPASFEAATNFQLSGKTYAVVSAKPMTAREFGKTGQLRIELRELVPVENVDPRQIRYSLPSLCEALPAIEEGSTKLGKKVLELHEDDWRQIEFVALTLESAIEVDLRAVAKIHREHFQKGRGFDALHMRKEVPSPLEGAWFTLADLRSALGESASWFDGVAFRDVAGVVAGGFAVKLPSGLTLYGTQQGGRVNVLAMASAESGPAAESNARLLSALAIRHQLCLIDWCRVQQVPPGVEHLRTWLSKNG